MSSSAPRYGRGTFAAMEPRPARIDGRRLLRPRDYLVTPEQFAGQWNAQFSLPVDGDEVSLELAAQLHRLFFAWHAAPGRAVGAGLARRYNFSRKSWSAFALGYRWPGHTPILAVIADINRRTHDHRLPGGPKGVDQL
jgi:hypothetical protein